MHTRKDAPGAFEPRDLPYRGHSGLENKGVHRLDGRRGSVELDPRSENDILSPGAGDVGDGVHEEPQTSATQQRRSPLWKERKLCAV